MERNNNRRVEVLFYNLSEMLFVNDWTPHIWMQRYVVREQTTDKIPAKSREPREGCVARGRYSSCKGSRLSEPVAETPSSWSVPAPPGFRPFRRVRTDSTPAGRIDETKYLLHGYCVLLLSYLRLNLMKFKLIYVCKKFVKNSIAVIAMNEP